MEIELGSSLSNPALMQTREEEEDLLVPISLHDLENRGHDRSEATSSPGHVMGLLRGMGKEGEGAGGSSARSWLQGLMHGPTRSHAMQPAPNGQDRGAIIHPYQPVASDSTADTMGISQGQSDDHEEAGLLSTTPLVFSWMQFAKFCGSGLLMSVSYLDPGNLEADIQVGVTSGYSLLWWYGCCAVLFGLVFQCLSGALGLVTGEDLAQHCGKRYPKPARILLWLLLEIAIVGADIQETIGSAIALAILSGGRLPLWLGCIVISISAFLLLLLDRVGFRQLEAVFGVFIGIEALALGMNFVAAKVPLETMALGLLVPRISLRTLPVAVGALGALVMPYNIFFQSSAVNLRPRDRKGGPDKIALLLTYMRLENVIMLVLAFIINVFVVCVFAEGFYDPNQWPPAELGLESAGDHLAERFGPLFRTLWAIGLLASGQVATISLTYAGQLVMTGLLGLKVHAGARMFGTRLIALVPTVIMAVIFEASNTFDKAAQLLNVAQCLLLPFALLPVLHMTSNREIMGDRFVSSRWLTFTACSITILILGINGYLLYDFLWNSFASEASAWLPVLSLISMILYYGLCGYFAFGKS